MPDTCSWCHNNRPWIGDVPMAIGHCIASTCLSMNHLHFLPEPFRRFSLCQEGLLCEPQTCGLPHRSTLSNDRPNRGHTLASDMGQLTGGSSSTADYRSAHLTVQGVTLSLLWPVWAVSSAHNTRPINISSRFWAPNPWVHLGPFHGLIRVDPPHSAHETSGTLWVSFSQTDP